MSRTAAAIHEERWRWIPALGLVLQDLPNPHAPLTSISMSRAEWIAIPLENAEKASHYEDAIRKAVTTDNAHELHSDVSRLQDALRSAADELRRAADRLNLLHDVVTRAAYDLERRM